MIAMGVMVILVHVTLFVFCLRCIPGTISQYQHKCVKCENVLNVVFSASIAESKDHSRYLLLPPSLSPMHHHTHDHAPTPMATPTPTSMYVQVAFLTAEPHVVHSLLRRLRCVT